MKFHYNPRNAGGLIDNASLSDAAKEKRQPQPVGKGRSTLLSWACKNNRHAACVSVSCKCECGHRSVNRK